MATVTSRFAIGIVLVSLREAPAGRCEILRAAEQQATDFVHGTNVEPVSDERRVRPDLGLSERVQARHGREFVAVRFDENQLAFDGRDKHAVVAGHERCVVDEGVIVVHGVQGLQLIVEVETVEPGETPTDWRGARLYLEVDSFERYGEVLDSFRANIRKVAGSKSADAIKAAIRFRITDVRPLIAPSP